MLLGLLVFPLLVRGSWDHLQCLDLLDARKELVLESFGQLGDLDVIVALFATASSLTPIIAAVLE